MFLSALTFLEYLMIRLLNYLLHTPLFLSKRVEEITETTAVREDKQGLILKRISTQNHNLVGERALIQTENWHKAAFQNPDCRDA